MSFLTILVPTVLFLLVGLRFVKRFNAEFRRQEMTTWPTAKAVFDVDHLQLRNDAERPGAVGELDRNYQFYSQGQAYTGKRLVADTVTISQERQTIVNKLLNEQREELTVRFNPAAPEENVLRVGHAHLTWWKVLVYAFFGVAIPVGMIYMAIRWSGGPLSWSDTFTF